MQAERQEVLPKSQHRESMGICWSSCRQVTRDLQDYEEILSQLQEFLCGDEIKYIYTMRMNGDTLEFIVDADTEEGSGDRRSIRSL